jgi:hypothetical protein
MLHKPETSNEIDVESYRDRTIPCVIGDIRPYFGTYLSLFHLHSSAEHIEAVRQLSSIRGFHIIDRTDTSVTAAFDADSLPLVLKGVSSLGKSRRGKAARLTTEQVREIRQSHQGGTSVRALAERHSVGVATVSDAINGKGAYQLAV